MKKIYTLDNVRAASRSFSADTCVIRIFPSCDPFGKRYRPLKEGSYYLFSYVFDHLYPKDYKVLTDEEKKAVKLFDDALAERILSDFRGVRNLVDTLVVHCDIGVNRSPAVAAALNHAFNLGISDDDTDYLPGDRDPNEHVYETLIRVAREKFGLG
jgi:protein-tyrosine phosphatase